jgi:hypothetical protein
MIEFSSLKQELQEKLIMPNNGARYGQVVFMAGGAGSGKGYAIGNLMNGLDYKTIDPDSFKEAVVKMGKLHAALGIKSKFVQFKDINFRNPKDVEKIHLALKDWPLEQKQIAFMLFPHIKALSMQKLGIKQGSAGKEWETYGGEKAFLPNIIFDRTLKKAEEIKDISDMLLQAGYKKENIHIIWVLTNWRVAMVNNDNRPRRVPDHILLLTHEGVGKTMSDISAGAYPPNVNGDVFMILGGGEGQVFYSNKDGKPLDGKTLVQSMVGGEVKDKGGKQLPRPKIPQRVIRDFIGIRLKASGTQAPIPPEKIKLSLAHHLMGDIDSIQKLIMANVPPSDVVKDFQQIHNDTEGDVTRARYGVKAAPKE